MNAKARKTTETAEHEEQGSAPASKVETVRMKRDPEQYPAPHEADVHPDEVDAYKIGGWI